MHARRPDGFSFPTDAGRLHQAWAVTAQARIEQNDLRYQARTQSMFRLESTRG